MEREVRNHYHTRAAGGGGPHNNTIRGSSRQRAEPELVPQWGNRKRLRCVKAPRKDPESNKAAVPTVRVDRRLARVDKEPAVLLRRAPPAHHRVLRPLIEYWMITHGAGTPQGEHRSFLLEQGWIGLDRTDMCQADAAGFVFIFVRTLYRACIMYALPSFSSDVIDPNSLSLWNLLSLNLEWGSA